MDADPLPEDTRQQLRDAQAALQTLLDYVGQGDSAGRAAWDQEGAADTCIEALIATIAVLGDVSFGDIRNISFVGEGRGLCDPGMFDSPACSLSRSRSRSRSRSLSLARSLSLSLGKKIGKLTAFRAAKGAAALAVAGHHFLSPAAAAQAGASSDICARAMSQGASKPW